MKISFNKNELIVDGKIISFEHPIEKILEVKSGIVVMLAALVKISDKNVYFVNFDGTIKWRIQNLDPSNGANYQYYTHIGLDKNGVLEVSDFGRSSSCKVDLENGTLYDCEFTK